MKAVILLVFLISLQASTTFSQAKVGEKAPELSVDEWLKGEPVTEFENGKVYLVEFWGTWCSPCIKNIPKLSRIQKEYSSRGLIVIGVATHEFDGKSKLMKFMDDRGSEMEYTVGYDADYSMEKDWDIGSDKGDFKLPVCFLVNGEGTVVFTGHPENEELDNALMSALTEKQ